MLENLRDKILNVQHDLSASFRNLATGEGQSSKNRKQTYKGISLNAGADLLHHYQELWAEIHENDATNAKKAEEVDSMLNNLHSYCFEHLSLIRQMNTQLVALPQLQTSIMDLMGKIGITPGDPIWRIKQHVSENTYAKAGQMLSEPPCKGELEGVFEEVEDALMNLEDVIEIQELQERQLDHRFQLAMYKEKKLADFEDMKAKLGEEHAEKVFQYEKKQEAILKERQCIFQEAFEEEIQEYKTHGIKELRKRISSTSSAEASVSLEDIDLGEDASALDEFLGEDTNEEKVTKVTEEQDSSENEVNSSEPIVEKVKDRPSDPD